MMSIRLGSRHRIGNIRSKVGSMQIPPRKTALVAGILFIALMTALALVLEMTIAIRYEVSFAVGTDLGRRIIRQTQDKPTVSNANYLDFCQEDVKKSVREAKDYTIQYSRDEDHIMVLFRNKRPRGTWRLFRPPLADIIVVDCDTHTGKMQTYTGDARYPENNGFPKSE